MTQIKKQPDWERIENDYRAGLLSVREIAASQGVSHVAIGKRAKRDGWERDLKAKIQAKADALVTKSEVTKTVTSEQAVAVGILSPLLERSRMKSEALLRGASLAFTLKGPAASLKSISSVLEHPIEKFGLDHCEALIEAHQRAAMPSLSPADLHALSLLLGKRKTLALATALGIIESLGVRTETITSDRGQPLQKPAQYR